MRPLLAAALLFAARPAFAQIDTRVDDVSESSDGFTCRAHALPDLILNHDWRDSNRSATWSLPARETDPGDLHMRADFEPDLDAPHGTSVSIPGFQLDLTRTPLRADAQSAHLRIDGAPDATLLHVGGDRHSLSLSILDRQRADFGQRLMTASIVEVDLDDAAGAQIARFSWDVRSLRRAPEWLQLINWSCR
jgi:hypothetical protein